MMENQIETTIVYWGNIGILENRMETTIVYWGYIGIMEKRMETPILYRDYVEVILGLCRDNGKENGNSYII